jgi:hypothetical protein
VLAPISFYFLRAEHAKNGFLPCSFGARMKNLCGMIREKNQKRICEKKRKNFCFEIRFFFVYSPPFLVLNAVACLLLLCRSKASKQRQYINATI